MKVKNSSPTEIAEWAINAPAHFTRLLDLQIKQKKMCRIIDELADKRGIKAEDANYIFANISGHLVNKVPALKEIIEDVFSDETKEDALREHIKKLVIRLQQHNMDVFKTWQMPQQGISRAMGNDLLL